MTGQQPCHQVPRQHAPGRGTPVAPHFAGYLGRDELRAEGLRRSVSARPVIGCVDEGQSLPRATLEGLRLLSNLETEKRKLIQIVLFGQPELDALLARPQIRQLMQRITFSGYLGTLSAERVPAYLEHRLAIAAQDGFTDVKVFDANAARALARYSGGVPRLVNVLAHKCLMLAFGEGVHRVNALHVRLAAADTPGVRRSPSWWKRLRAAWRKPGRPASPIALD